MGSVSQSLFIILVIVFLLMSVHYIINGIVLTKLSKLKNEKSVFLAWIPFINKYYLGKVVSNSLFGIILFFMDLLATICILILFDFPLEILNSINFLNTQNSIIILSVTKLLEIVFLLFGKNQIKKLTNKKVEDNFDKQVIDENGSSIEILDLDSNSITKEEKKEARKAGISSIIILLPILLVAFYLPELSKLINKAPTQDVVTAPKKNIEYYETQDGLLEINNEKGHIIAKNIRFYSFTKKTGNIISNVYLPDKSIDDASKLNVYIELYNSKRVVIYRTKFNPGTKLNRKVQSLYEINLSDELYKEVVYVSINILETKDFNDLNDILVCTYKTTENNYNLVTKVTYNFSSNGLSNYEVSKESIKLKEDEIYSYKDEFKKEAELLTGKVTDLTFDENSLKYKLDLVSYTNSEVKPLYSLATTKREIKLKEENSKWSCN